VGDEGIDMRAKMLPGCRRLDATRELAMALSWTSFEANHSSKKAMMFERQILLNHLCFETHNSTCWRYALRISGAKLEMKPWANWS
jgi:hypothetical protein